MKKIGLILLCLLFSSCFQITEIIKHKSDNSGSYSLIIDFSKSWVKTRTAILLGDVDGVSIPSEEEIQSKLAQFKVEANNIKGVTNISTSNDFNNYVFKLNFSYNSIETLNKVLNSFNKKKNLIHCKMENRTFVRNTDYPFPKNLTKNDEKKDALQDASITTIYTFDKDVAQIENAISKVSKSKKTVVLKQSIWNALQNKNAMNNKITLTP
jgi:hypothetical protein